MRAKLIAVSALMLLASERSSHAAVYPWTGSATILGSIDSPTTVSVDPLLIDPGWGPVPSFFFVEAFQQILSTDAAGNVFDRGHGGAFIQDTVTSNPSTDHPGFYANQVFLGGTVVKVSDAARFVSAPFAFTHGAGIIYDASYEFVISVPDGLSVAGLLPIASAVPEPSTWAMLLIGFVGIGFAFRFRKAQMATLPDPGWNRHNKRDSLQSKLLGTNRQGISIAPSGSRGTNLWYSRASRWLS
jgi:hypothetical protein